MTAMTHNQSIYLLFALYGVLIEGSFTYKNVVMWLLAAEFQSKYLSVNKLEIKCPVVYL